MVYTKQNGRPLHGVLRAAHLCVRGDVTVLIVKHGMIERVCKCLTGKATYHCKTSRVPWQPLPHAHAVFCTLCNRLPLCSVYFLPSLYPQNLLGKTPNVAV